MTRSVAVLLLAFTLGCGKSAPTSPTPQPPVAPLPPAPAPINRYTVIGIVSNIVTNSPVGGVSVTVTNTNTNVTGSTDGNGYYSLPGVAEGNTTFRMTAPRFNPLTSTATIAGDHRQDARMFPFFSRSGIGNTVFDMPTTITRLKIIGTYTQNSSNFIVRIGGRLVVNELLGTGWQQTRYEGVHLTSGGITEITNSSGVVWEFSQEQ